VPRFAVDARGHVADLFADTSPPKETRATNDPDPAVSDGLLRLPARESADEPQAGQTAEQRWDLLAERRLDPNRPASGSYQRTSDWRTSTTDPDATPIRIRGGTRLGYHDHYVVDRGEARIVLA
jgi:hypothetical protein